MASKAASPTFMSHMDDSRRGRRTSPDYSPARPWTGAPSPWCKNRERWQASNLKRGQKEWVARRQRERPLMEKKTININDWTFAVMMLRLWRELGSHVIIANTLTSLDGSHLLGSSEMRTPPDLYRRISRATSGLVPDWPTPRPLVSKLASDQQVHRLLVCGKGHGLLMYGLPVSNNAQRQLWLQRTDCIACLKREKRGGINFLRHYHGQRI